MLYHMKELLRQILRQPRSEFIVWTARVREPSLDRAYPEIAAAVLPIGTANPPYHLLATPLQHQRRLRSDAGYQKPLCRESAQPLDGPAIANLLWRSSLESGSLCFSSGRIASQKIYSKWNRCLKLKIYSK